MAEDGAKQWGAWPPTPRGWTVVLAALVLATALGLAARELAGGRNVKWPEPTSSERFDPAQAMAYLRGICELGPRITASDAMARQQDLLERHFQALGATVERQAFTGSQPSRKQPFPCVNLVVRWHSNTARRVLLGVHYDTRPIADREPLPRNRRGRFLGANDGGSGVALLMEMGRRMPNLSLPFGVDFVFFDAEEFIHEPGWDKYFLGSEHFANDYKKNPPGHVYEAVIVADMIGDKRLEIHPDQRSVRQCMALVEEVWRVAADLGIGEFHPQPKYDVLDDHIAFQDIGLPAIVLIDFDYPHWHRLTDTPDKCSGESMEKVANVLVEWLRRRP